MVSEGFLQVYEGVCRVLGTTALPLEIGEDGHVGFGLHLGEVEVQVAASPWVAAAAGTPAEGLLLMVEFSPPEGAQDRALLEALLDANLLLGAAGGPIFSRNPVDGCLLLVQGFALAGMSGERLHALALGLAELARAWRSFGAEAFSGPAFGGSPFSEPVFFGPAFAGPGFPGTASGGTPGPAPSYA